MILFYNILRALSLYKIPPYINIINETGIKINIINCIKQIIILDMDL